MRAHPSEGPSNRRILVADDNPTVHLDLARILVDDPVERRLDQLEAVAYQTETPPELQFELVSAYQGHEAVDLVAHARRAGRPFAVAFIDSSMPPGFDGIETVRRAWQSDPELQVVMCTAYSDKSWREITSTLGAGHNLLMLRKPFDVLEVKQLAFALSEKWTLQRMTETRLSTLTALVDDLDHFTRVASHDLQAPLRAVANLASWLRDDLGDALTGPSADHLTLLCQRVNRMETLLQKLNDYTAADKFGAEVEQVDVAKLAWSVFAQLRPATGFTLAVEGACRPLTTSRTALTRVLTKVMDNALVHHDRPDGRIEVRISTEEEMLHLEIEDDGPGIDPKYFERVFGLFVTLQRRDELETAGAGLAMARKIVHRVGGSVRLNRGELRGTIVTIEWPLRWAPATRSVHPRP